MSVRDGDCSGDGFRPILVSAPAKIILHGEHAVVYGHTAVAASIGIRSRVNIDRVSGDDDDLDSVVVNFSNLRLRKRWRCVDVAGLFDRRPSRDRLMSGSEEYQDAIRSFLEPTSDEGAGGGGIVTNSLVCFFYLYSVILDRPVAMEINAESDIPIGAGLGSSAAISVCLAAALLNIKDPKRSQDLKEINCLAHLSEKILNGPLVSGLDNNVSTYGGMVVFRDGTMQRIRSPPIKVLLVDTAVTRSTRNLVDVVSRQLRDQPDIIKPILSSIDGISKACVGVFESIDGARGDEAATRAKYKELERLVDYNHDLLKSIRVSHPKLEKIVRVAADSGLHAKLTGAGGGGFAYVLLPPYVERDTVKHVKKLLQDEGFRCWETMLDPKGVSVQAAD